MLREFTHQMMILSTCCLLLLMPVQASAEESNEQNGEMNWKVDRIIEKNKQQQNDQETELETRFPELFKDETAEKIASVKQKNQASLDQLENGLFSMEMDRDTTIKETKESLFATDYEAPKTASTSNEENSNDSMFSTLLMIGLVGVVCVISGGIYVLYQRLID
ncbi:hypothetical protein J416_11537 [Gracilibacillus halophilus YIM-C55.5]|uniref:Uncharacterized protein n=1 Tax=Gracilibacillus halophilus YIM-C55.5 TaxID=1308866 RepID=N4WJG4_9BACI|nr:type VII secretion protein EssA [Gracilibacillus halophilus]ENH96302.1 hypothetical protein J416_11537 [Gracilibacillus halophilus YIM-C55.5]